MIRRHHSIIIIETNGEAGDRGKQPSIGGLLTLASTDSGSLLTRDRARHYRGAKSNGRDELRAVGQ